MQSCAAPPLPPGSCTSHANHHQEHGRHRRPCSGVWMALAMSKADVPSLKTSPRLPASGSLHSRPACSQCVTQGLAPVLSPLPAVRALVPAAHTAAARQDAVALTAPMCPATCFRSLLPYRGSQLALCPQVPRGQIHFHPFKPPSLRDQRISPPGQSLTRHSEWLNKETSEQTGLASGHPHGNPQAMPRCGTGFGRRRKCRRCRSSAKLSERA